MLSCGLKIGLQGIGSADPLLEYNVLHTWSVLAGSQGNGYKDLECLITL